MFDTRPEEAHPEMAAFEADVSALEAEIAELVGVINAANGQLVALVGDALSADLWKQWGIHSPAHWLGWQAGLTPAHAEGIVQLAARRAELPTAVAALRGGEISLDAAVAIGRRAPAGYDQSTTEFARVATMGQLNRCLAKHRYDPETEKARPQPREDTRSFTSGIDDRGWWCKGRLAVDEGAAIDQAVRTARDDRYRALDADRPADAPAPQVSLADGLLAVAEAALAHGAAAHPGSDRYLVHLHLDATPTADDPTGVLSLHLGPPLPAALQSLLLCDATLRPVFEAHGAPISVGRTSRTVNQRTRRAIEHRDRGCRVPGCGRTFGLDIHHITHWEHGGPTDTPNLVSLCRSHHRLHHTGHLGITGNADLPAGQDGALVVTDPFGRPLDVAGKPVPKHPSHTAGEAAAQLGIAPKPGAYQHTLGERLQAGAVHFNPDPAPPTVTAPPSRGPEPAAPTGARPATTDGVAPHPARPPDRSSHASPGLHATSAERRPDRTASGIDRERLVRPTPAARPGRPRGSPRHEAA